MLDIPGGRLVDVGCKKMHVGKTVVAHRVDLDQFRIGARNIQVIVVGPGQWAERRVDRRRLSLQPFVLVLHVDAAPADVPDAGIQFAVRRLVDLVEEQDRTFDEQRVGGCRET